MKRAIRGLLDALNLGEPAHNIYKKYKYLASGEVRRRNAGFLRSAPPGMPPVPPPDIIYLVTGGFDQEAFHLGGRDNNRYIRGVLDKNGLAAADFGAMLDFGCGCGRVVRHWIDLEGTDIHGVDYNPVLIDWCRNNLTFATFGVNKLGEKLDFEEDKFDFIYAISVFTHLTADLQDFWIGELRRILKPGGHLLITTHGESFLHVLTREERERYEQGELVVARANYPGTNLCSAHQSREQIEKVLAKDFEYVDFVPVSSKEMTQDVSLLRKPA